MEEPKFRAEILALLAQRAPGTTICPSEVARRHGDGWRELMPAVREAAAGLAAQGSVVATRSGVQVDPLAPGGPIRLGRGTRFPSIPDEADDPQEDQ